MTAELYKLLIYEEGGFFKAHRDTEKTAGMFGTLIVVLPSAHRGGELVVRHAGREVILDLSSAEVSELRVAAFYADCEHEVRPVTGGYRVCLVYNLVQSRAGKGPRPLAAPSNHAEMEAAAGILRATFAARDAPAKLAWLFKHEYSPAGLSFAGLKGEDAVLAKTLRRAAETADCAVHLGIVHIEETGPAEPDYSDYSGGWGYDDHDGADEDTDFEVVEVSDARSHVGEWHDTEDHPVDFGHLPLEEGEVLPAGALDGEKPDEQKLLEATGNEGASFERAYHRAALVIWPRERFADVLLQAGVGAVLPHLTERVNACAGAAGTSAPRRPVIALARRIIKKWEDSARPAPLALPGDRKEPDRGEMLGLLVRLGDAGLLERFIGGVVTQRFDGSEGAVLAGAAIVLGPSTSAGLLAALTRARTRGCPRAVVSLLDALLHELGDSLDGRWKKALAGMVAAIIAALPDLKPTPKPASDSPGRTAWDYNRFPPKEGNDEDEQPVDGSGTVDADFVTKLFASLGVLGPDKLCDGAAAAIVANHDGFDPVTIVVPALTALGPSPGTGTCADAALARLWRHAAEFVLARSEHPPVPPTDWKQKANLRCPCEDCRELQEFARDPVAREHRFRIKKARRQHLHQAIQRLDLDMTHETEREGSPQTLVCTKTLRTFERHCSQHKADVAAMSALLKLPYGATGEAAGLAARMSDAQPRKPRPGPSKAKR